MLPEENIKKAQCLDSIIAIYNHAVKTELTSITGIIAHFIENGIKNEFQLESLHNLIIY